jgi:sortase A
MLSIAEKNQNKNNLFKRAGWALIGAAGLLFVFIFYPAIFAEVGYFLRGQKEAPGVFSSKESGEKNNRENIIPKDEQAGIVIPKIRANASIILDVNAQDPGEYQKALTRGVAHARGTSYPGESGNIFLFSHSGTEFYQASRYNAIFYLLDKLENGDEIYLFYRNEKLRYRVKEKKVVGSGEVQYMQATPGENKLTLMTCWPPGTTFKRLIVLSEES